MRNFITSKVSVIFLASLSIAGQVACTKQESAPPPPARPVAKPITPIAPATPEATVNRLTNPPAPEVKPHRQEAATRFPEAMPSLGEKPMATPAVAALPPTEVAPAEPKSVEAAPTANTPAPAVVAEPVSAAFAAPVKGLTADGSAAELKERDWTGVVLVPLDIVSSSAYTVQVMLEHVEAHPLTDGSVRVWLRLRNRLDKPIYTEVGCSFRTHERPDGDSTPFYGLDIAPSGFSDVFFISPKGKQNLDNYTVLVRSENMLRKTTVKMR